MKRSKLLYTSVAMVVCGIVVAIANAQTALSAQTALGSFDGTYTYVDHAAQEAAIANAIAAATASMTRSEQNRWRAQLDVMARPPRRLTIDRQGTELSVENSSGVELRSPTSGASVELEGDSTLNQSLVNGQIEQRIESDDVDQLYKYSISEDKNTLTVEVTITSPELSQPVTFSLPYARQ